MIIAFDILNDLQLKISTFQSLPAFLPFATGGPMGQKKTTFGMGFHEVLLWARRLREKDAWKKKMCLKI